MKECSLPHRLGCMLRSEDAAANTLLGGIETCAFFLLVPLRLAKFIKSLYRDCEKQNTQQELSRSCFYVSAFALRVSQLLAVDSFMVSVPDVTSVSLFNHSPMSILTEMLLPRDSLNLSLSKMGTRIPGQSRQIHLAQSSFTVLKCHSDEMLLSADRWILSGVGCRSSKKHDQWATEDAKVRRSAQDTK